MKTKKSLRNKIILLVIILTLGSIIIYNYSKTKEKENNLYNLGASEQVPINLDARAICIFNESLLDISNDKKEGDAKPSLKLLRNKDKIADKKDLRIEDRSLNLQSNKPNSQAFDIEELARNIASTEIYKLNISSNDSINQKNKFYEQGNIDDLNGPVRAVQSGYLANFTDGYEEIITADNLSNLFDEDLINNKRINLNYRQKKFVDNKFYYILAYVEDIEKYKGIKVKDLAITFRDSKKSFNASDYRIIRTKAGRQYLIFTMNEGIEYALTNRIKELNIEINKMKLIKIPSEAIVYNNKDQGVYYLSNARVQYARIKKVYENDNYSYCLFKKEDIYSKAYLEKVEKNNKEIGYKASDDSYINIFELKEYSSIILDPSGLKVGDKY